MEPTSCEQEIIPNDINDEENVIFSCANLNHTFLNDDRIPSIILVEYDDVVNQSYDSTSIEDANKDNDCKNLDTKSDKIFMNADDVYFLEVQGPINKEPEDKLSPQNRQKAILSNIKNDQTTDIDLLAKIEENSIDDIYLNNTASQEKEFNENSKSDMEGFNKGSSEKIQPSTVKSNTHSTETNDNTNSLNDIEYDNLDGDKFRTPQKRHSKLSQNLNNATSTLNMSMTDAFMSTYNILPSNLSPSTRNLNQSGIDRKKKPWYSAFTNTYKQKNEEFKKLFRLQDEFLLVDYSCALQREILAHGRLYISLNYVCFRANIIGWETTLAIKLKDIKNIFKDRTAKIIPNAITIVLEHERYFFTSFSSRDKTYMILFRVWQIALVDASMSHEEISNILKTSYGEDLGYDSDDAEYEYYSKFKCTSENLSDTIYLDCEKSELYDTENSNNSETSQTDGTAVKLIKSSLNFIGHRQSSSYDTSNINKNESDKEILVAVPNTTGVWIKRPKSMLVSKQSPTTMQKTSNNLNFSENSQQVVSSLENNEKYQVKNTDDNNNTQCSKSNISNITDDGNENVDNGNFVKQVQFNSNQEKQNSLEISSKSAESNVLLSPPLHDQSNLRESSSDSLESDLVNNKKLVIENNVKCSCINKHQGKEMVNQVYDVSVNYLWECLFGQTEFRRKYWDSRKFINLKVEHWNQQPQPSIVAARKLQYQVDLGALGKPYNIENQRIFEYKSESCVVIESESETQGVLYSDYFTVRNRFCITRVSETSTRLVINSFINYILKPNFIAKSFIEKNCFSALKDSYNYLEKHLPNMKKQPLNTSFQISALTNSKTNVDAVDLTRASTPTSSNTVTNRNINQSEDDLFSKESPVKDESYQQHRYQKANNKYAANKATKRRSKIDSNNYNDSQNENDYTQLNSNGNNQFQAQLVPIQTFSFFKWKINVDTLVRLFIIAMVCLMVINGMLYYKLRRIESLADGLRTDPTIAEKISLIKNQKFAKNSNLNENFHNELFDWRDVISNTLNVIEKMELSLKEWDKNLEKRQILEKLIQNPNAINELSSQQKKMDGKPVDDL